MVLALSTHFLTFCEVPTTPLYEVNTVTMYIYPQKCSEILCDTVEGGTARGTTALVYLQLHISLYTGTVHVLSRVAGIHPTSLTVD
jgi:hypothetical protein